MKNVHLIPTDIPRFDKYLVLNREGKLCIWDTSTMGSQKTISSQNVYITSDEYIGLSWYLDGDLVRIGVIDDEDYWSVRKDYKKIVMTNDPKLNKDGVQEVGDEFLDWFVKNQSCEYVKVKSQHIDDFGNYIDDSFHGKTDSYLYKIIIHKEEPKQIKCYDKFNQLLSDGDYVDVQKAGIHQIYKKDDGQLYFKPYSQEEKVSSYFSNDMVKSDSEGNLITNNQYESIKEKPKQEKLKQDRTCTNNCSVVCGECHIFEPKQELERGIVITHKKEAKSYICPKKELTMVDELKDYFKNNSKEKIQKDWDETCEKTKGINSPTIEEFLKAQKQFAKEQLDYTSLLQRVGTKEILEVVKPPVGKFIIDNAVATQGSDGAYYHYSEVCKLLRLQQKQNKKLYNDEYVKKLAFDFYCYMSRKMKVPENLISENETNIDVWFENFKNK